MCCIFQGVSVSVKLNIFLTILLICVQFVEFVFLDLTAVGNLSLRLRICRIEFLVAFLFFYVIFTTNESIIIYGNNFILITFQINETKIFYS